MPPHSPQFTDSLLFAFIFERAARAIAPPSFHLPPPLPLIGNRHYEAAAPASALSVGARELHFNDKVGVSRRAKAEFFHPLEHRMMTARDLVNPELALESLEVIDEGLAARHADESVGEGNVELPGKRRTENESPLRGVGT